MWTGRLVIFDGDDTLWYVEPLYDAALDQTETIVAQSGLPGREWRSVQRELDLRNVESLGMSAERFPLSSRQAVLEVARRHGVEPSDRLVQAVLTTSRSVFSMKAPLVEGAEATLQALTPYFKLILLTKGDELVQRKRVEDSGLGRYFERVDIVRQKTSQSFSRVVKDFDAQPDHCWSVGNSLASDINPALREGLHAIWIDAHVWEHERRETSAADPRLIALARLGDVVDVLLAQTRVGRAP